jgi:hypothetical protein
MTEVFSSITHTKFTSHWAAGNRLVGKILNETFPFASRYG